MPKEENKLEKLKKDYAKIRKKYGLPEFNRLNEDFGIEKASESESDFVIREIRRIMIEKVYNYFSLIETLLNPSNTRMSLMSAAKTLGVEDREKLSRIYKKIASIEIELIEVDVDFSEKREAEFVKEIYKTWQEIKEDILHTARTIKKNWNNKSESVGKGYFG